MNTHLLATETFGELMTRPFWEPFIDDPYRFASPAFLGSMGFLVAAWKVGRWVASRYSDLKPLLDAARPLIDAWLEKTKREQAGVVTQVPAAVTAAPLPVASDPLAFAAEQYRLAKASGDTALATVWQKTYNDLKSKPAPESPPAA